VCDFSPLSTHRIFEEYLGENDNGNILYECKCWPTNDFKNHMEYNNYIKPPKPLFECLGIWLVCRCARVCVCGGGGAGG
jgi:hypothetical protein